MACYIFGAGSFYGLSQRPAPGDTVIAADGGWEPCRGEGLTPDLLLGDFDSLHTVPDFAHIRRVPVEKDDTDMIRAVKEGFARGETEFHLLGGMGGRRTDHTLANMQTLAYIARHGGRGFLQVAHAGQGIQQDSRAARVHAALFRQGQGAHPVAVAQNEREKIQFSRGRKRAGALIARGVAL